MLLVGFEPTIQVFEWEKTVHAVDCAATVIGLHGITAQAIVRFIVMATRKPESSIIFISMLHYRC
jgi:hypothetical protein